LLDELRNAWADSGRLSTSVIDQHPETHCAAVYKRRFGSLEATYDRLGYSPSARQRAASQTARTRDTGRFKSRPELIDRDVAWAQLAAHYRRLGRISSNTIEVDPTLPSVGWYRNAFGSLEAIYARLGYTPSWRQRFHIDLNRIGARNYRRPS
jgi:phage terminase small subunit